MNFQMFKLDLEKTEESEIKLPTYSELLEKQKRSRKTSTSALLTRLKSLTMWITTQCGNTRPPHLPPVNSVCRSRSNC